MEAGLPDDVKLAAYTLAPSLSLPFSRAKRGRRWPKAGWGLFRSARTIWTSIPCVRPRALTRPSGPLSHAIARERGN